MNYGQEQATISSDMIKSDVSRFVAVSNRSCNRFKSQLTPSLSPLVLFAVVCSVCLLVPLVSARYLPTRSNDSERRMAIKDILRLLLNLPQNEEDNVQQGDNGRSALNSRTNLRDMYEMAPIRVARSTNGEYLHLGGDESARAGLLSSVSRTKRAAI